MIVFIWEITKFMSLVIIVGATAFLYMCVICFPKKKAKILKETHNLIKMISNNIKMC